MKLPGHKKQAITQLLISKELNKNNFDLIRFLLAAIVIYSHCYVIAYGVIADVEPLSRLTRNQAELGGIAVSFFFAISGFLIVRSFEYNSHIHAYFSKRLLRIVPGFVVAFLVSVFLFGALGTATATHKWGDWKTYLHHLKLKRILWQLFTLEAPRDAQTFATSPLPDMINEALWTIQYEFICYMLVPALGFFNLVKRKWAAVGFFLLAYIALVMQTLNIFTPVDDEGRLLLLYPSELARFFTFFSAGAVFYFYRNFLVRSPYLMWLSIISLVLASQVVPLLPLVLPVSGTYLLFYFVYHRGLRFYSFAKKGDFSYGLYLYGWPIQQLVLYFFAGRLNAGLLLGAAFPLSLLAAYGSWHLVEKPFLKLKGKLRTGYMGILKTSTPVLYISRTQRFLGYRFKARKNVS